jgi:hypothetical protein
VSYETAFLFGSASFLEGAGRVMDLGGSFDEYNRVGTSEQVDALMLCLDWLAIGEDLRSSIREYLNIGEFQAAQP